MPDPSEQCLKTIFNHNRPNFYSRSHTRNEFPNGHYLAKKQSEDRVLFFVKQVEFGGSICENVEGAATNYSTIGIDMLSRFRVTLDYPNRRLYLKAAADLKRDIPPDALGAVWIKDERGIIIDDLDKESPAYDAGLQIGDRLLRVNREAVEPKRLSEVRALFCESGKAIPIEIQRGKETYAKVITLHRTFPYPPIWPRKTTKLLD